MLGGETMLKKIVSKEKKGKCKQMKEAYQVYDEDIEGW